VTDFNARIIDEFRSNGGRVEHFGDSLVLLHTTGARTGEARVAPVMALPAEDGWLVAASKAGAPEEPAWAHNFRAHPAIEVETGTGPVAARAVELHGPERDAAWARFTDVAPGFADYEKRTTRTIAVFHLVREA
jgi:deazaflavin-dependent oxidoreductase (nitroreductase family)